MCINGLIACYYGFSGEDNSVDSELPSDDELPECLLPDDSHNSRQTGSQYLRIVWWLGFNTIDIPV